jgi:hypothetical protein
MKRRQLFPWLAVVPFFGLGAAKAQAAGPAKTQKLKIMMKSAWGSDDPTRASFPFVHGLAWLRPATKCKSSSSPRQPI